MLALVTIGPGVISSYSEKPLRAFSMGRAAPDTALALEALCAELPWLRITELWRDYNVQLLARQRYEKWLAAGKPSRTDTAWRPSEMKTDFVAKPGKSMHNAGRAIDVWVDKLREHLGPQYLDAFWPIAAKYGFTPVITKPEEGKSESWHFDHWGPWASVRDRLGYEQTALAAALVVGNAGDWQSDERVVQAHLHRLGMDVGEIDGVIGRRTIEGVQRFMAVPDGIKSVKTRSAALGQVITRLEAA